MVDDVAEPDLSLVETQDLIRELVRRHDASLIVLERDVTGESVGTVTNFWGGLSRCIGLAELAKARMLERSAEERRTPEG